MMFTVMPGGSMAMGKSLAQWFVSRVVVGIFAAYVAAHALPPPRPPGRGPDGGRHPSSRTRSRCGRCRSVPSLLITTIKAR